MVSTDDASGSSSRLPCLVADAAAFLRNVDLQNLGNRIFTIREVVSEIRDAATKQRLAVLPYDLDFRTPSAESIQFVTEFSKKTGDYKALSAVDIKVLALTYQLEKEFCSVDHIVLEPSRKVANVQKTKILSDKEIAGFFCERKDVKDVQEDVEMAEPDSDKSKEVDVDCKVEDMISGDEQNVKECDEKESMSDDISCKGDGGNNDKDNLVQVEVNKEDNENSDSDDGEDEDEGGSDGWITPGNIKKVKQSFGAAEEIKIEDGNVKCACLTTDFAMQNVLIQMGLHVLSVKGMLIRQARSYIQKCFGCFKETHDMVRIFCPSCGNKTLQKIAVSINEDGVMQYHYPKRYRNPNIRGTKFSIPAPKGGRIVDTILLAEDQPVGRNRLPRASDKADPLDPDYVARTNPFSVKDVNSRAVHLGLHVKQKQLRNPNENRKKKSGRKK